MLEAVLHLGRALAVESRLPEPADVEEIVQAPAAYCWKESLPAIREFLSKPELPPNIVSVEVERLLQLKAPANVPALSA
jgi:hypothetical protein